MKYFLSLFLLFSMFLSYSQDDGEVFDNDDDIEVAGDNSEFQDRFYLGLSNSYLIDFITSPLTTSNYITYDPPTTPGGPSIPVNNPNAAQTVYSSLFSIGMEPRYNLVDLKDNVALAVAAPISIGFGQAQPATNAVGGSGFGHIQVPVLLKLYSGAASTYKAEDDFGISVGAGMELNKLGLFNFAVTEEERTLNKAWVMPVASLGVHFYRGMMPMEVNVKYGFGEIQDQYLDQFGQRLPVKKITRASSLKLSIVYSMSL